MEPEEIITDKDRIARLVEMLQKYKWGGRHPHAYLYDGKFYIEMPGVMVVYDWCLYLGWHNERLEGRP